MPAKPEPKKQRGKPAKTKPAPVQQPKQAPAKLTRKAPVIPEPARGWSILDMSRAAHQILGDHRESVRDASLVVCSTCQGMRRRGPVECLECDSAEARSYARLRAEILDAGTKVLAGEGAK